MDIQMFLTPGLGDATYLVASEGEAALIDPQRDAWRFIDAADRWGWRITHVLETHVHNDYVSGARQVHDATGAEIVAPASGGYRFPWRAAGEGSAIAIGDVCLVGMATPGHTPEHIAWQIVPGGADVPAAILTGGSLLVGSAGRPDLLGPELLPTLAQDQFRSLQRLAALPGDVRILPTHGAGSFCVSGPVSTDRESTIATELATNPYLRVADENAFRQLVDSRLGRYPAYYDHMAEINRSGPALRDVVVAPPKLGPERLVQLVDAGARVVDARDRRSFAQGHIPRSIHVEPTEQFGSWVGAVVPFNAPLVIVVDSTDATLVPELVIQLWRIGYEHVIGYVAGGMETWIEGGRREERHVTLTAGQLADELAASGDGRGILDVRQPTEWHEGVIPGSRMIFVGDLPDSLSDLPRDRTWTVICRSGARASIAASVLLRAGHRVRVVTEGGVPDILERSAAGTATGAGTASAVGTVDAVGAAQSQAA
jgi:hydroxyacylglutathione hydrolase